MQASSRRRRALRSMATADRGGAGGSGRRRWQRRQRWDGRAGAWAARGRQNALRRRRRSPQSAHVQLASAQWQLAGSRRWWCGLVVARAERKRVRARGFADARWPVPARPIACVPAADPRLALRAPSTHGRPSPRLASPAGHPPCAARTSLSSALAPAAAPTRCHSTQHRNAILTSRQVSARARRCSSIPLPQPCRRCGPARAALARCSFPRARHDASTRRQQSRRPRSTVLDASSPALDAPSPSALTLAVAGGYLEGWLPARPRARFIGPTVRGATSVCRTAARCPSHMPLAKDPELSTNWN